MKTDNFHLFCEKTDRNMKIIPAHFITFANIS